MCGSPSFCSMNITHELRELMPPEEAAAAAAAEESMQRMSAEFKARGAELYH